VKEDTNKDAWSMGKGLVNLGNLKQSMSLKEDQMTASSFSQNSTPVYIKTTGNSTNNTGEVIPKFIPGVFMAP
jgi:hypothetical protein